jgi:hypothetical protein
MKALGTCKGCGRRRLINAYALCKRCNKDPTRFLSKAEIEKSKLAQEAAALAAREAAAEKAAAEAAAEAEGEEEGEEGEETPPSEGEEAPEAPSEDES